MADRERALVTGATGVIGPALVASLVQAGYHIRVLARSAVPPGLFPATVEIAPGTINDRAAVAAALADVNVVFHLAAQLHINDPAPALRARYTEVNVEGTRTLVDAANAAQVRRFIHFSTINVYGPSRPGQLLDERSPLQPDSWYAETKAQAEEIALAAGNAAILRLSAVYGPGMKGNYLRLLRAIERGRFVMIGDGRTRRTLVHLHDVATAALLAGAHPAAQGRVYNVTDGAVHTLGEIVAAQALAVGRRPPRLHLPVGPIRLAVGLIEDTGRLVGRRPPIGRATLQKLLEDVAVDGTRIATELGFQPAYDLLTGWQRTVQELEQAR